MSEKDNKTETLIKVGSKSAAPYVIGLGVLAAGAYYLSKKDEEISDFLGGIGAGVDGLFSGVAEGAAGVIEIPSKIVEIPSKIVERTTTIISETGEAVTDVVTVKPESTKSPKTKATIKARSEPGQAWSLEPETIKAVEEYVSTPGGVVEELLEKYIPKRVPTGELSEYTIEEQKRTVFEDNSYKGPSLLGWLTRPAGAIAGTGLGGKAQEGVYVEGLGIVPKGTIPGGGFSKSKNTKSRKAGTGGYEPTITPAPVKPAYTSEETLARFKADISSGISPITGQPLSSSESKKSESRKVKGGLTIRKVSSIEKDRSEAARKRRLKIK